MIIYKVVLVDNHTKERKVCKEFDNILEACNYIDDIESFTSNEHNVTCHYGEFKVDIYKSHVFIEPHELYEDGFGEGM